MTKPHLYLAFLIAVFCVFSSSVYACSCAGSSLLDDWKRYDNILIVEASKVQILEAADEASYSAGVTRSPVEVVYTYKGTGNKLKAIKGVDKPVCCMCQTPVYEERYLIFAGDEQEQTLSACSSSKPLRYLPYREEVLTLLRMAAPTEKFSGILDKYSGELLEERENARVRVLEMNEYFESDKLYVEIEGYRLSDGRIFFVKLLKFVIL